MKAFFFSFFLLFATAASGADMIIGGETSYVVQKGERLELIGAKLGVFWKNIARENGLDPEVRVTPGQQIRVTTRKIVPRTVEDGIIVNIADRTLYLFKGGNMSAYPVGVGVPIEDDFGDWRTPTGKFTVTAKRKNPIWFVPESIQMELAAKGKTVEEAVPPGPKNPLGRYALQTSIPGVLIHETIKPASVYRYQSHGCIRVLPVNMEKLFGEVEKGTKGEIIYEPVKVAVADDGRTYLEVRTDTYRKLASLRDHTWKLINERQFAGQVDPVRVERVIREQSGIAEDVTLRRADAPVVVAEQQQQKKAFFQKVLDFFKSKPRTMRKGTVLVRD
jgi:L,D-transpeptidase ErfK/SrfK